jgi:hypothetical protein
MRVLNRADQWKAAGPRYSWMEWRRAARRLCGSIARYAELPRTVKALYMLCRVQCACCVASAPLACVQQDRRSLRDRKYPITSHEIRAIERT